MWGMGTCLSRFRTQTGSERATSQLRRSGENRIGEPSDVAGGAECIEDARDHSCSVLTIGLVHGLFLQHFRVSQNDTELIVQPVKQAAHFVRDSMFAHLGVARMRSMPHTCPIGLAALVGVAPADGVASRHSVSAKMRIDPPAVRTYSTFPAAIQLYIVRRLTPTASHAFMMDKVWRSIVDSRLAPGSPWASFLYKMLYRLRAGIR
jgi:hypothetical protein